MAVLHKFLGEWGERFEWSGSRTRRYANGDSSEVKETWLIGKAEQAKNFALRYYEIEVGGRSNQEQHAHDHGIIFLHGEGEVLLNEDMHDVAQGDVVYIPPDTLHQIINSGNSKLGFLCIIPAMRRKKNGIVWAEDGWDDLKSSDVEG